MKKLLVLMLGAVVCMNVFGQNVDDPVLKDILERREKLLSDMNESNYLDFFSNEESLLKELGSAITKTKDKATKQAFYDYAKMCFNNLYVGSTQYAESNPTFACHLLDSYFAAAKSKEFNGAGLEVNKDAYFVNAVALQSANGDMQKIMDNFALSLESSYGATACQQLVALCQAKDDKAGEKKYQLYGYEHFPQYLSFGLGLSELYFTEHNYEEVIKLSDALIKRVKEGDISEESKELDWYPYYHKATALFNSEKYDQAYYAYVEGDKACPNHEGMVITAGVSAVKYAINHSDDISIARPWYDKAIEYLKKAEKAWPKKSDLWAYQLFVCYYNLGDEKMAAKYRKYMK